ncbi:hypothetical protein N7495_008794 [Penicillium taxi]|uniref:uncharacterized protein n=1 Tax=Penicillium taxi TaxID=168475 RepID=UPI0025455883|nr:uncharacterized protein N7495_008794 [Penicillium taxi]KAJ5888753.1 hypothetical protein N7495_008794 [Penicillium taxi]
MAPRSQIEITTSSVLRLVREEASYHRELEQQAERIKKLEDQKDGDDENKEYLVKQENRAFEETKQLLPILQGKILDAVADLKNLITEENLKPEPNNELIAAANEAINTAS